MGTEGEQAVLEEDPPALLSPRPLPFDQLGLLPLFFHLSRSAQTREEGVTRDCPTFRRRLAAEGGRRTGRSCPINDPRVLFAHDVTERIVAAINHPIRIVNEWPDPKALIQGASLPLGR